MLEERIRLERRDEEAELMADPIGCSGCKDELLGNGSTSSSKKKDIFEITEELYLWVMG